MNTQALGGSSYYFVLIEDYIRKTWVYFLKEKCHAFKKFEEWLAMVEAKTGRKLKKLQIDFGSNLCSGSSLPIVRSRESSDN